MSGSWSSRDLDKGDRLATAEIGTCNFGLCGNWNFASGLIIEASLACGAGKSNSDISPVLGGLKRGDFESMFARSTFGWEMSLSESARPAPSAGIQFTRLSQDGWRGRIVPNTVLGAAVGNWFGSVNERVQKIPFSLAFDSTCGSGALP